MVGGTFFVKYGFFLGGFISGGRDGVIRIYNKEGEIIKELFGHAGGITSLAHGPDNTIISGSWDGSFRVSVFHPQVKCRFGL